MSGYFMLLQASSGYVNLPQVRSG